jgi:hypothetical protein
MIKPIREQEEEKAKREKGKTLSPYHSRLPGI